MFFYDFKKGFLLKKITDSFIAVNNNTNFKFLPPRHIEHIAFIFLRKIFSVFYFSKKNKNYVFYVPRW